MMWIYIQSEPNLYTVGYYNQTAILLRKRTGRLATKRQNGWRS